MSVQFLALIVVYESNPLRTSALKTLRTNVIDSKRLRILIWDNSLHPQADADMLQQNGLLYRSTPENLGLSSIYNHVISRDLRDGEHLILLDQDTVLTADFLVTAETAIGQHPNIDLFLPMIQANGNWVSPLNYFLGWGRYWSAPRVGRMKSSRICAINSGMVISARYLLGRKAYDERLRFYGTDTQFMVDYAEQRDELVVLDVRLSHDLSFFSDNVEQRARKFVAMRGAYTKIYENRPWVQRLGVIVVMTVVSLIYACRYQSHSFLKRET